MSREIDERIVAMYFDNQNFERNAQKTIQTLDELKESANMKGIEKGLDMFEKIGEKLNLEKINQSAQKLKTTISSFGNIFKSAFSLGPLDEMYNALTRFKNNYFDRVLGFDIAQQLARGLENTLRSLTVAPISAGYTQYEQTMDSIKTIMSSTGENLDTVKNKLAELTDYANQTVYSLSDMTSNIGKFTNNGVKLDDATNAMIGLANATAAAGQGAAQASMAMYNVSQAIGVGKMTTIDWKSLENANIATRQLKQTFIESAAAAGTLDRKVTKVKNETTGMMEDQIEYWTKAEKGSQAVQVTYENFRDTLSKGWLTKDAMMSTFAIYSNQLAIDEIAALGFSQEEAIRLKQIGEQAMAAATEVRTFHKMMDALKESVQSSWATSFEYIFGDLEEGTSLWTNLNNKIDAILTRGAEERNNILMAWRGMMRDENGQIRRIEDVYNARKTMLERELMEGTISQVEFDKRMSRLKADIGDTSLWTDYRTILVETFMDLFDSIQNIFGAITGAWSDVFGLFTADTLKGITQGFRDFVDMFKNWLGDANDADSRLSKIRKAFTGLFSVIKAGYVVFKTAVQIAWSIVKPIIDPVLNLLAKIGEFLNLGSAKNLADIIKTLGERFGALWDKVGKLGWSGVLSKIGEWFGNLWEDIKTSVSNFLIENGLEGVVQWFIDLGDNLKAAWEYIKGKWEELGLGEFFRGIWKTVTDLFKPQETIIHEASGYTWKKTEPAPIVAFFNGIASGLKSAWEEVKRIWESLGVADFFTSVWESVSSAFQSKQILDHVEYDNVIGRREFYRTVDAPIVTFFKNIYSSLESAWNAIVGWFNESGVTQFFTNTWEWIKSLFTAVDDGKGGTTEAPIVQWFGNVRTAVVNAFDEFTKWWNRSGIPDFFKGMFDSVVGVFKPQKVWHEVEKIYSKDGTKFISNSYKNEGYWEETDSPIVAFFKNLYAKLEEIVGAIKQWWEDNDVSGFFAGIWETVSGVFKEGANGEQAPIVQFLSSLFTGIKEIWSGIVSWEGWGAIAQFISNTFAWIVGLFNGDENAVAGSEKEAAKVKDAEELASALSGTLETFNEVAADGKEAEKNEDVFEKIGGFFSSIFTSITEALTSLTGIPQIGEISDNIVKILEMVHKIITDIVNFLHRVIFQDYDGNYGQAWLDNMTILIGVVITIVSKISQAKKLTKLATIAESGSALNSIGMQILEIAAAIVLISFAVEKLGAIPLEQLVQGEVAVLIIGAAIGVIIGLISKLETALKVAEPEKAWERVVGKLIQWAGMAGMLWILLEKLPDVISALSAAKKESGLIGDDLLKTLEGLVLAVAGTAVVLSLLHTVAPKGIDPMATLKTLGSILLMIGGAALGLIGIGALIGTLGSEEDLKNNLRNVTVFMEGLGDIINGFFRGLLGTTHAEQMRDEQAEKNLEHTKTLMDYLSEMTDTFDSEQINDFLLMVGAISDLSKLAEGVKSENLSQFAGTIKYLIEGVLEFMKLFTGTYHFNDEGNVEYLEGLVERGSQQWQNVMDAMDLLKQFFASLEPGAVFTQTTPANVRTWFENLADQKYIDVIIQGMNNVIDSLGGLHDASGIEFDGFAIVKRFYESVADVWNTSDTNPDLPKFDGMPLVNAILDSLIVGDYAIKEAIKLMVQDGINLLGQEAKNGMAFDFSGISGVMSGLNLTDFLSMTDVNYEELLGVDKVEQMYGEATDDLTKKAENSANKMAEGLNLKVSGISLTDADGDGIPDIIGDIETEVSKLQETLDSSDEYAISIRPIFNLDNMGEEMTRLREFFNGEVPLSINGNVSLGEGRLPIDDTNIVDKLEQIRQQMSTSNTEMQMALNNATSSLSSSIVSLGRDIANMKVWIESKALVGAIVDDMDAALYEKGYTAMITGVP